MAVRFLDKKKIERARDLPAHEVHAVVSQGKTDRVIINEGHQDFGLPLRPKAIGDKMPGCCLGLVAMNGGESPHHFGYGRRVFGAHRPHNNLLHRQISKLKADKRARVRPFL